MCFIYLITDLSFIFFQLGVAAHEVGHVAGLYHEHQRPDRDDFVTVVLGNIKGGDTNKDYHIQEDTATITTYDTPYDYYSLMHYAARVSRRRGQWVNGWMDG